MTAMSKANKKEPYFPFTQAIYEALIAADLTAAEWRFWGYLVTLDPFGNGAKYDPAEAMVKCGLGKSTYFRAKGKLQKLGFNFKDGATKVINLNGVRSQSEKSEKLDSQSEKLDSQSEKLDSQSEKLDSVIYIDRAGDQSISNSSKTYSNSFQMEERASECENFASLRSEPSEPVSATPPVESLPPANSPLVEAEQVAEDQLSATARKAQNFENCVHGGEKTNKIFNAGADAKDWEDYPGYPQPGFVTWYGDRYYDPKGARFPKESWARTIIRRYPETAAEAWAEYQAELQRTEQAQLAIATPAPEPEALPAQQPALDPAEARSQFLKNAQQLWWAGGASRTIALKSCKTHGFLVDPDTGPYDPELEVLDEWEDVPAKADPAIAAQIRESLGFQRPAALFVNPCTELGDWEEAV